MNTARMDELVRKMDELISSGGVTRRCVSLAQGTLSPDMRVNYEFGMVLGVDDFRQEQRYFLHKEYLHNHALHGFGTVAGLRVVPEAAGSSDVKLTLTPGMGIDQCGRVFVVCNDQCAFLQAWFERERQQNPANLQPGAKRLYVVGTYDECPDALVTIAGQPCSSSEQNQVASRIRDSFQISLRWAPPAMPTWEAIQCFAELLADVRIEPDLPQSQSDKAEIIELVRLLDDCAAVRARRTVPTAYDQTGYGYGTDAEQARAYLYLPAETARANLDDIFRVWVTEVRPRLQPDVIACGLETEPIETGVLLAALEVQLDYDADDRPLVTLFDTEPAVDDTQRPYLLSTQLIQQLLLPGGSGSGMRPQHEFATLHVRDNQSLLLWVHHPEPLNLAGDLASVMELFSNDAPLTGSIAAVTGFENVFSIQVNEIIPAGARIELRLRLNAVRVGMGAEQEVAPGEVIQPRPERDSGTIFQPGLGRRDPLLPTVRPGLRERLTPTAVRALHSLLEARAIAGSTPLLASLDLFGLDYIGRDGDVITMYTTAADLPDVREFVTATTLAENLPRPELRLWFHTDVPLVVPTAAVTATRIRGTAEIALDFDMLPFGGNGDSGSSMWVLRPRQIGLQRGDIVRLRFSTDQVLVGGAQLLTEAMHAGQYTFVGYDGVQQIETFHVVEIPVAPGGGISEEQVRELLRQVRTLPFVTITPLGWNRENQANFELWVHPNQFADEGEANLRDLTFRVYIEIPQTPPVDGGAGGGGAVVPVGIDDLNQFGGHHFNVRVNLERLFDFDTNQPTYVRFVFPLDEGNFISNREGDFANLREYMERLNIKFDGYYAVEAETGQDVLMIYVRFDQALLDRQ